MLSVLKLFTKMKLILVLAVVLGCAVLSQAQVENWEIPLCKICTDWVGELVKLLDRGEQYAQEVLQICSALICRSTKKNETT